MILDIKDQVCSLEYAKELKELGLQQDSYFSYCRILNNKDNEIKYRIVSHPKQTGSIVFGSKFIAAYTLSELSFLLPFRLPMQGAASLEQTLMEQKCEYEWMICYRNNNSFVFQIRKEKQIDARALMLIFLIKNKYFKVDKS